jgi:hypothetical protein
VKKKVIYLLYGPNLTSHPNILTSELTPTHRKGNLSNFKIEEATLFPRDITEGELIKEESIIKKYLVKNCLEKNFNIRSK